MEEENKLEEVVEEVQGGGEELPDFASLLKQLEGAPSQQQIDEWKKEFGEVNISGFSPEELCVWRPLRRFEFVKLQRKMMQQTEDESVSASLDYEDDLVSTCLLWPNFTKVQNKAGTVSTLATQISEHSNFVQPQVALQLVRKL